VVVQNRPTHHLLGEVVAWDLRQVSVAYVDVINALGRAKLDPDYAKALSARSAWTRAARDLKESRQIDRLEQVGNRLRFQFTHKSLSDVGVLDFTFEHHVELDLTTGQVSCATSPELESGAQALVDVAKGKRSAHDITRIVQQMFSEHADLFPVVPRKGVAYFVPTEHRAFTAKVEQFLQELGGTLSRFPVPRGTQEGTRSVRETVDDGLKTMVEDLNLAVDGWDIKTKTSTIKKAQKDWEKIALKTEAYANYLGSQQKGLTEKLAEARTRLRERMLEVEVSKLSSTPRK